MARPIVHRPTMSLTMWKSTWSASTPISAGNQKSHSAGSNSGIGSPSASLTQDQPRR